MLDFVMEALLMFKDLIKHIPLTGEINIMVNSVIRHLSTPSETTSASI